MYVPKITIEVLNVNKIGRNDSCPCGSGKKYKKCCMDKDHQQPSMIKNITRQVTYEEVDALPTDDIISKLETMGIPFDRETFLKDVETFYSAEKLSENWFSKFPVIAPGREEDIPWLAAWILWERLAPSHILSMEQIGDILDEGYDQLADGNSILACDAWLKAWEAIKFRIKPDFKTLHSLDRHYKKSFYIRNICQDLEMELHNAGLDDPSYFEKRISFCREFCEFFPEEEEGILHSMRRAFASSYASLDDFEEADKEFKKLVEDYPNSPWGYIGWGDAYFFDKKDYKSALALYEKALPIAKNFFDIDVLQERIEDVKSEIGS